MGGDKSQQVTEELQPHFCSPVNAYPSSNAHTSVNCSVLKGPTLISFRI